MFVLSSIISIIQAAFFAVNAAVLSHGEAWSLPSREAPSPGDGLSKRSQES